MLCSSAGNIMIHTDDTWLLKCKRVFNATKENYKEEKISGYQAWTYSKVLSLA